MRTQPDDGGLGGPGISRYRSGSTRNSPRAQNQGIDVYSRQSRFIIIFGQGQQSVVSLQNKDLALWWICSLSCNRQSTAILLRIYTRCRTHQRIASVYGVLRVPRSLMHLSDDNLNRFLRTLGSNSAPRINVRSHQRCDGAYAFYGVPEGEYHFAGLP